jgi:hypothetical protein
MRETRSNYPAGVAGVYRTTSVMSIDPAFPSMAACSGGTTHER